MFKRAISLINTFRQSWSDDPSARGAAKMTAGGFLVFEGILGGMREIGDKSEKGILASIITLVIGVAIVGLLAGWIETPHEKMQEPVKTEGKIVSYDTYMSEDPDTGERTKMHTPTITYTDKSGQKYTFESSGSTANPEGEGTPVKITYGANDPEIAYRADGITGFFNKYGKTGVLVLGWVFIVGGAWGLLVSITLISFGIWLLVKGREDRKMAEEPDPFLTDLMNLFTEIRQGNKTKESAEAQ